MDIGKRLHELRLARGIGLTDLGARTGMPQDRIAAVEEGTDTPAVDALGACAGGLGVEMYELFLVGKRSLSPRQRDSIGTLSAREKKLVRSLTTADQRVPLSVGKKMAGLEPRKTEANVTVPERGVAQRRGLVQEVGSKIHNRLPWMIPRTAAPKLCRFSG